MRDDFQKKAWILNYTKKNYMVDIMNAEFVDKYISKFAPEYEVMMIGAHRCPEIGKLLSSLYRGGFMDRVVQGIEGRYEGMPKWVYCYTLTDLGEDLVEFDDLAKEWLK